MPRKANPYIRVTEVTSFINAEWYKYWAKSVGIEECERVSKESTDFGKAVHKVAENYLIGTEVPPTLTNRELFCGGLIVKWCKETNVKPIMINNAPAVECTLTSEKYGYRGHPDLLCTFGEDTTMWVADWKTSKESRLEYPLQMSAYAGAAEEEHGLKINDGVIVRTPSDPNAEKQFETHPYHDLRTIFFPVFLEGLDIVQFFKRKGKWKEILKGL
jgi:hypothetical protein